MLLGADSAAAQEFLISGGRGNSTKESADSNRPRSQAAAEKPSVASRDNPVRAAAAQEMEAKCLQGAAEALQLRIDEAEQQDRVEEAAALRTRLSEMERLIAETTRPLSASLEPEPQTS